MRKIFSLLWCALLIVLSVNAQVGIGTNAPHPKAALEIKSTDKGVLFPMMTTSQRDAIDEPPNGLHIFNTDESCLNYYNSTFNIWVGYCDEVKKIVTIRISANASAVDFYNVYAKNYPGTKNFIIIIQPGVTLTSGGFSIGGATIPVPALVFAGMPSGSSVKIINNGNILGAGGSGGNGPKVGANSFNDCAANATNGSAGGDAIGVANSISITVDNYGIIAGGGGGGGGGGRNNVNEYGGGGGGGAPLAIGGSGGGTTAIVCFINCVCSLTPIAQNGINGLLTTGGSGGAGASNGGNGGNGGNLGQSGQNGSGTGAGTGGLPGRAVFANGGASGIIINNINGGQVFGVVQ